MTEYREVTQAEREGLQAQWKRRRGWQGLGEAGWGREAGDRERVRRGAELNRNRWRYEGLYEANYPTEAPGCPTASGPAPGRTGKA
jgi:hypothetical protein